MSRKTDHWMHRDLAGLPLLLARLVTPAVIPARRHRHPGGTQMAEHDLTRSAVTRFRDGVPVEVAAVCSCSDLDSYQWVYGNGSSLPECLADLTANFNAHVEAS